MKTKATASKNSLLALCIGINNYPGTGSDLSGCVNDANDWAKELNSRGYNVEKLLDKNANGANIRKGINATIAKAKRGDTVIITYSGHGTYVPDLNGDEPDGLDEAICPHDTNTKGVITDDELFLMFNARGTGVHLAFLSDSCHSGTVSRFAPITTPATTTSANAPQRTVRFLPPSVFMKPAALKKMGIGSAYRASKAPGRYAGLLLSGCQDHEYSYDAWYNGRPNGAFTFVALKTLKTLPAGSNYTAWYKAIRTALPSRQYAQTPNLYGDSPSKRWKVLA